MGVLGGTRCWKGRQIVDDDDDDGIVIMSPIATILRRANDARYQRFMPEKA